MKASIIRGTLVVCTTLTLLTGCPEKSSSTATPESGGAEPSAVPAAAPSPEKAADQEPKAAPKKEEGGW